MIKSKTEIKNKRQSIKWNTSSSEISSGDFLAASLGGKKNQ